MQSVYNDNVKSIYFPMRILENCSPLPFIMNDFIISDPE